MVLMSWVIKLSFKLIILEVNVGDTWVVLNFLEYCFIVGTKLAHSNGKLLELHDVLREGARLVTEDVVDHAQFLVEAWWLDFAGQVPLFIQHLHILHHEVSLDEVDHLQRHEKWNGHEVHQSHEPYTDVEETLSDHIRFIISFEGIEVPGLPSRILSPNAQDAGAQDGEGKLDRHSEEDEFVEHLGIFGAFWNAARAIFHDLGVMASENAQTCNPLGVAEWAAFQKYLVGVKWELRAVLHHKITLKLIEVLIWLLTLNHGAHELRQHALGTLFLHSR